MRTFNEIYRQMKHYPAFNYKPQNSTGVVTNMSCFLNELREVEFKDMTETVFRFALMEYNETAKKFNLKNEKRTFKEFLEDCYNKLK